MEKIITCKKCRKTFKIFGPSSKAKQESCIAGCPFCGQSNDVAKRHGIHDNSQAADQHWSVRESQTDFFEGESESEGTVRILVTRLVEEELRRHQALEPGRTGKHPDGDHCAAQICMTGHVRQCDGREFSSEEYCSECGTPCIDACQHCKEPIRGTLLYQPAIDYQRPSFCHACGRAYPWMEERLRTARELLYHDDQLTQEDRESLWPDLQYVMSNPKADLVPAKKKLIDIKLCKATGWVREAILDLTAKTIKEMTTG